MHKTFTTAGEDSPEKLYMTKTQAAFPQSSLNSRKLSIPESPVVTLSLKKSGLSRNPDTQSLASQLPSVSEVRPKIRFKLPHRPQPPREEEAFSKGDKYMMIKTKESLGDQESTKSTDSRSFESVQQPPLRYAPPSC